MFTCTNNKQATEYPGILKQPDHNQDTKVYGNAAMVFWKNAKNIFFVIGFTNIIIFDFLTLILSLNIRHKMCLGRVIIWGLKTCNFQFLPFASNLSAYSRSTN